jgi:hypothetical protein
MGIVTVARASRDSVGPCLDSRVSPFRANRKEAHKDHFELFKTSTLR